MINAFLEEQDDAVLKELRAATTAVEKAAIVAEYILNRLSKETSEIARRCSVLHWFDEAIVKNLMQDIPDIESSFTSIYKQIISLPFVESLPWGWAFNNLTREGLVRRYAASQPELLRTTARLAAPAYEERQEDDKSAAEAFFCYILVGDSSAAVELLTTLLNQTISRRNWDYIYGLQILRVEAEGLPSVQPLVLQKEQRTLLRHAGSIQAELEATSLEAAAKKREILRSHFGAWVRAYGSAIYLSLIVVPALATAITIGIYLAPPIQLFAQFLPNGYSVVLGTLFTILTWLIAAIFLSYFTNARRANAKSYALITSRLDELVTRLEVITKARTGTDLATYQQVALNEAHDKLEEINQYLHISNTHLPWIRGYGYENVWSLLHRVEEALIEVEPIEMVLRGATHDRLAIMNSKMNNRDELLARLYFAIKKINPTLANQFKPRMLDEQSEYEHSAIEQLRQDIQSVAQLIHLDLRGNSTPIPEMRISQDSEDMARARLILREVRQTLHEFRDQFWEALNRARNRMLGAIFLTGLLTYILLITAILSSSTTSNGPSPARNAILAATTFYIAGALAGIFGQISRESQMAISMGNKSLSFARLMTMALNSGLAGIGGVTIFSFLESGISFNSLSSQLLNVFVLNRTGNLIVATICGFVATWMLGSLYEQITPLVSALLSTRVATRTETTNFSEIVQASTSRQEAQTEYGAAHPVEIDSISSQGGKSTVAETSEQD